ncbi:hypothetical protein [Mycobacteroides abscessus]|uniref:hypothetical protein n=1 Tax=Mycobacteroides abscessus TaxID=36809 RepID=UPI001054F7EA|nr:hypothetical protein [Mycobacteroides abscessus]
MDAFAATWVLTGTYLDDLFRSWRHRIARTVPLYPDNLVAGKQLLGTNYDDDDAWTIAHLDFLSHLPLMDIVSGCVQFEFDRPEVQLGYGLCWQNLHIHH